MWKVIGLPMRVIVFRWDLETKSIDLGWLTSTKFYGRMWRTGETIEGFGESTIGLKEQLV